MGGWWLAILTAVIVGTILVSMGLWVQAELDERRWRRRLNEAMGKQQRHVNVWRHR